MILIIIRKFVLIFKDIVCINIFMKKNRIFFDIYIKIIKLLKFFLCKFFILIKKKKGRIKFVVYLYVLFYL